MKTYLTLIIAIFLMYVPFPAGDCTQRYEYIGAAACGACHSRAFRMDQYDIWISSPHARAFRTLLSDRGKEIGARNGVAEPGTDSRCLTCHATGEGKSEKLRLEGVGCEACHGPGSGYGTLDTHTDFRYRKNGYLKAKKNGMYPVLDDEPDLKKREKVCLSCHGEARPCLPLTSEEILRQKITIQTVDTLRKGELDISHPIRRY